MRNKKLVLLLSMIIISMNTLACHRKAPPPPRDAKVISETEMDTGTINSKPAGGGGTQLNEKQW